MQTCKSSVHVLPTERHGAIGCGTPQETSNDWRASFAVMGMYIPHGYTIFRSANTPFQVHSTAFRPIERPIFLRTDFGVLPSLLRLELD